MGASSRGETPPDRTAYESHQILSVLAQFVAAASCDSLLKLCLSSNLCYDLLGPIDVTSSAIRSFSRWCRATDSRSLSWFADLIMVVKNISTSIRFFCRANFVYIA